MKNIVSVFRLIIDNKIDLFKGDLNKKVALKAIAKLIVTIVASTFILVYFTRKIVVFGVRINTNVLSLVLLVSHLLAIVFAVGNIIKNLYLSQDNELLMCLPTTHNQVFFAKLLSVYTSDFLANLKYFFPIFLTVGIIGRFTFIYYLITPLFLLVLPILAVAIAGLISMPVMIIVNIIKKNLAVLASIIIAISGVFIYYYVKFASSMVSVINIAQKQIETVMAVNKGIADFADKNKIYNLIAKAMLGENVLLVLPTLLVVSVATFLLVSLLVKPFFFKMATAQTESSSKEKIFKRKDKVRSPILSLIHKESKVIFRSPGYLFQYFIFTLLMPFIVYMYDKLLLSITISMSGEIMIIGSHIMVLAILVMLSTTISASAISREGSNYYLTKSTPINYKKQAFAKIAFNSIIVFIAIVATTVLSILLIDIRPLYIILSSIVVFLASIGHMCLGFDLDLRNPTLDWYDSSEIDEMSKNTAHSIIVGLIISFLMGLFMFILPSSIYSWGVLIFFAIFYTASRSYLLNIRIDYYFEENEI